MFYFLFFSTVDNGDNINSDDDNNKQHVVAVT